MKRALEMALVITAAVLLAEAAQAATFGEWHWARPHFYDIFWWLR